MLTIREKDRDIEKEYQNILTTLKTSSDLEVEIDELLFTRIRVGIKSGELKHEDVKVVYKNTELVIDKDGRLAVWPENMFDRALNFFLQLL
jgi:hypothetical protein